MFKKTLNPISGKEMFTKDGINYSDKFYYFSRKCPWRIPDFDCWYNCSVQLETKFFFRMYKQCNKENCAIWTFLEQMEKSIE